MRFDAPHHAFLLDMCHTFVKESEVGHGEAGTGGGVVRVDRRRNRRRSSRPRRFAVRA
jgi:hypothetical protein